MQYTQRFTENYQLAGADADAYAIGVYTPFTFVSMANNQRAVLLLHVGDMEQGATVDLALLQATTAAAGDAKAITGKAITQLTQAGGDAGSNVCIELRTEEMDVDGGFTYVGAQLTVAGGAVDIGLFALLGGTNQAPVPTTAWDEIVD